MLVYFQFRVAGEAPGQGARDVLAYHITVTLSSLNSCLDPVVYCFVTDSFKRMWRTRRRRGREEDGEVGFTSGVEGERNSVNKCSGTALAIAQSIATLTLTSAPLSAASAHHSDWTGGHVSETSDGIVQRDSWRQ